VTVSLEVGDADPTATVLRAIRSEGQPEVKDAIVRLQISAPEEVAGQLRDNEIREALKAAYFSTVAKDIKQEARPRLNQTAEEIPPLQALKTYLETNYTPERAQILLEYGERLIEGQTNEGN
ncbi:MAG TPA: DNA double-strand break repair protein Mre11, partial [Dehalococcoidales bacterium]|nr:DNA double-strand break repair protein Mre11 [Dehalococcoidales bacterium]